MEYNQFSTPPANVPLHDILPTEPMLLMGAGPVPIPHAVARANGVIINHLGETMGKVIDRVKIMAKYVFQTNTTKVFGISGPSSAAMEMAISNLLWPGKKVLVLKNGIFSGRFGEMAEGIGAGVKVLEPDTKRPFTVDEVENELKKDKYDMVTLVQGETSCGIENIHLKEISRMAKAYGAMVVVDAVCTLTALPLQMDEWDVDVVVTGGQKGLSSIPGVSLIAFSELSWQVIENRKTLCPHWCLDARRALVFWGKHGYHYTAPVPGILATYEALRLICEETLEKRFQRHEMSSEALQAGIEGMGLELFVPKSHRLNPVVAIKIPEHVNADSVRAYMAKTFNVEIAGAFGLPIIRIGQMGEQCRSHNLFKVLYAMGMAFKHEGFSLNVSQGMAEMEKALSKNHEVFLS
jgi:alanine-glyoxylate transaminase / serine-glyoxylate transaminase / serine-pyruvate transaminase